MSIDELKANYEDEWRIMEYDDAIRVTSKVPLFAYPGYGQTYVDYQCDKKELSDNPNSGLEYRCRKAWLRDSDLVGFQGVAYDRGLGIWQVTQARQPLDIGRITPEQMERIKDWLRGIDELIFNEIPELRDILL